MLETRMKWEGGAVKEKARDAAARALFESAAALLQEANKKCPHRTGYLQSTGRADVDHSAPAGWVSYNTPYAVRLHEHPEYRFGENREGKWLERAMERMRQRLVEHIKRRLDGELR